jgi:hypothetical protein
VRIAALGSHAEGDHVGQTDDGYTYVRLGGEWIRGDEIFTGRFYQSRIRAIGLHARITSVSGNQLTLNKNAAVSVTDAIVHWDGAPIYHAALQNAANGAGAGSRTVVNANSVFPGRTTVAMGGAIVPQSKSYVRSTCDSKGSILFYSPPGSPCLTFQWRECTGCVDEFIEKRGNWTIQDFGLGWEGSTVPTHAGYLGAQPTVGQLYQPGTEWRAGSGNEHRDQIITNVPIRAAGADGAPDCWARRVVNIQTDIMADYVQYQMQWANCDGGGTEDCEIISTHFIPGPEAFHSRGVKHIRFKGTNCYIAMNDAGQGWEITGARLRFTAGCVTALEPYPSYGDFANAAPSITINHNAGTGNVAGGGTIADVEIVQEGYLDSQNRNYVGIQIQDQLPSIRVTNVRLTYPPVRVNYIGAVGIQSYAPGARYSNITVSGQAINSANNFNIFVVDGIDEGGLVCDQGGKMFNWVVS